MASEILTSGNLTADRRFAYAHDFAGQGDFTAAIDLMNQTMELVPNWAAGWFRLGEYHEVAGHRPQAIAAYRKCLDLSATDRLGAGLKVALLEGRQERQPSHAYAEALFDDYADKFDTALVEKLGYRVPQLLHNLLEHNLPDRHFERVLDLGCGTGLMAAELRSCSKHLMGADLSARMLEKANAKALYDKLWKAELVEALVSETDISLVTAADVFMYLPALDTVFDAVTNALSDGGYFLFSVEKADNPDTWQLLESRRHAHGRHYVDALLEQSGLEQIDCREEVIRMDSGKPLAGLLYLARKGMSQA